MPWDLKHSSEITIRPINKGFTFTGRSILDQTRNVNINSDMYNYKPHFFMYVV